MSQPASLEQLNNRVQQLEAHLQQSQRQSRRAWLVAVLVLAASALTFGIRYPSAHAQAKSPKKVFAQSYIVTDAKGNPRGAFTVGANGPAIIFFDANKKVRMQLFMEANGNGNLGLLDSNGVRRATLGMSGSDPVFSLYDAKGGVRASLTIDKNMPRVVLIDEKGKVSKVFK